MMKYNPKERILLNEITKHRFFHTGLVELDEDDDDCVVIFASNSEYDKFK